MHFKILFKSRDLMLVQAKWYLMLCVQNITHKNEALHGYVSPRVGPRELYRLESTAVSLEIALKIIITVTKNKNQRNCNYVTISTSCLF